MANHLSSRRAFLRDMMLTAPLVASAPGAVRAATRRGADKLHVGCNQYSWAVFYGREGRDFGASLDAVFADVVASGLDGFEPGVGGLEQIEKILPLLIKHGLEMRSLYVNSVLHETKQAKESIKTVLAAAAKAKACGTRIIVTNPSPLQWGGSKDKDDQQLRTQAVALDTLGAELKRMGLTLAYHNHDMELRRAAREFHHMMLGTDPAHVSLCLDAHWVYRGSGNSQVALFDIVKLYGSRVTELHLRQSKDGVWTEVFGPGDIDYPALADRLVEIGVRPLLVLEQAIEKGSPHTKKPVEAFKESTEYTRRVFARLQG